MNKRFMTEILTTAAIIGLTATSSFAASQEAVVTASSLNLRALQAGTKAPIIYSLKEGELVTILGDYEAGFVKVKTSNGKIGKCASKYLKNINSVNTSNVTTGKKVVTADKLNVRTGPSTSYSVKTSLAKGTTIEVISTSNGWSKIKLSNGTIGYCSSQYLGNNNSSTSTNTSNVTTSKKVVTADKLNVRTGPSTFYSVKTSLAKGTTIEVISTSNGWSKIKLSNGTIGYCSSEYLGSSNSSTSTNINNSIKKYSNIVQSYTTFYSTGNNRAKNVELAAKRINGTIIKPNGTFSYKQALGPITKANGFYDAPVMTNGVADSLGVGGGVCQVSSTLYGASLKSGLTDIKSKNHSGRVSYMPAGVDAVISNNQDLIIRNTYKEDIVIYASAINGKLDVQIRSINPLLGGKSYDIRTMSSTSGLTVDLKLVERNGSRSRTVYERTSYYVR